MACEEVTDDDDIYVILVDGDISKDGYFAKNNKAEADRLAKKYEKNYTTKVMLVKKNT